MSGCLSDPKAESAVHATPKPWNCKDSPNQCFCHQAWTILLPHCYCVHAYHQQKEQQPPGNTPRSRHAEVAPHRVALRMRLTRGTSSLFCVTTLPNSKSVLAKSLQAREKRLLRWLRLASYFLLVHHFFVRCGIGR